MQRIDKPTDGPAASALGTLGVVRNAAALQLVTLSALLAAGMIFGVNDLAVIKAVVAVTGVAIWGVVALLFVRAGWGSLVRWLRQAPPADPLHDLWLDE